VRGTTASANVPEVSRRGTPARISATGNEPAGNHLPAPWRSDLSPEEHPPKSQHRSHGAEPEEEHLLDQLGPQLREAPFKLGVEQREVPVVLLARLRLEGHMLGGSASSVVCAKGRKRAVGRTGGLRTRRDCPGDAVAKTRAPRLPVANTQQQRVVKHCPATSYSV